MKVAVLGTGTVGRSLAGRLAELGHEVSIGTRDPAVSLARTEPDGMGAPGFGTWAQQHPAVAVAGFATAAAAAELVVNASSGQSSLAVLQAAGSANLAGKVLLDVANPLDFSAGFPPTLSVCDTDSLAEQIQRAHPQARVVKALNTMTAGLMVHPDELAGGHSAFVSGDDPVAKQTVIALLESFGHTDVIDLGELSTARGSEMLLPLWLRLYAALGTPIFNFKIVR